MLRRLLATAFAAAVIAGCGSGSPTASPAVSPAVTPPAAPTAASTEAPPSEPGVIAPTTMSAACTAVGVRKLPSSTGTLIVRLAAGTRVRVVEVVPGDPYEAGRCGTGGDTWLKIDQVGGKDVETVYGVAVAYAAAGFFE